MRLKGKKALITGSSQGIGKTIAIAFAREGAEVAVNGRNKQKVDKVAKEISNLGFKAIGIAADVSKREEVEAMVERVLEAFETIDILVNNVGEASEITPIEKLPEELWNQTVNSCLKSVFLCSTAVGREMIKRRNGVIVNVLAASAHRAMPLRGAYGPSKAAVLNLTQQLALEWAKYNIRVNGVSPGPILTQRTQELLKNEKVREKIKRIPLGRVGLPEEVASAVVFLASDEAKYITGQTIIVDGGSVLTWYLYP